MEVSGPGPGCQGGYRSGDLWSYDTPVWRSVVQVLVVRVDIGVVTYEAMTPQCLRSVVQVLVVRVDIGVVTYEAMTPQCGRSVVQVLVVRVDIGVVIYEAMTHQCVRSVVQVLVVIDICGQNRHCYPPEEVVTPRFKSPFYTLLNILCLLLLGAACFHDA